MTPIQTNKPLFFNSDGQPLNGTVYVGQPSQDPRTNPKTVTFRDAGGSTFTASQPMTTINGRIVYNGKPIVALADGEYSLLVFDSAGAQVDYAASVNSASSGGSDVDSDATRVGLLLSDVKAFNVSVGDTVRSVGKTVVTDNFGADWLAVSATGNPADDVNLMDFDNGLQGKRINNFVYKKDQTAYEEFGPIDMGGDFSSSDIYFTKVGNIVFASTKGLQAITSAASDFPTTASGVVPEDLRPSTSVSLVYAIDVNGYGNSLAISSAGTITFRSVDFDTGARTTTQWGDIDVQYMI